MTLLVQAEHVLVEMILSVSYRFHDGQGVLNEMN